MSFSSMKCAQASISLGYLDFVDMHEWFLVSWNDVYVRRDDIDWNFIVHVKRAEYSLKIVSKPLKSKKFVLK